jgi:hypothetical protein
VIIVFILWPHQESAQGSPYTLVFDVYATHRTGRIITAAEANEVELLFVPECGTGSFPQTDRSIFGDLKARAWAEFARGLWRGGSETIDYGISVEIPEKCCTSIPADSFKKAWNVVELNNQSPKPTWVNIRHEGDQY